MSKSKLPERASLEYLKKLAKDRLREMRRADPRAKLATALLAVAQDYGFPSWRALKAEVDQRQQAQVVRFFEACAKGEVDVLRGFPCMFSMSSAFPNETMPKFTRPSSSYRVSAAEGRRE